MGCTPARLPAPPKIRYPAPMIKVRVAPSPTGYLHVGNARAALVNYLFARANSGHFMLRLDDTDTARGRPEYEQAIYDDLHWLGLDWDSTDKQSLRFARYAEIAEQLKASGRLYPCFENAEELAAKRAAQEKRKLPPVYDRAALALTPAQIAAAIEAGNRPHWRFKLSPGEAAWQDLILGNRRVKFSTVSDPVLIREDGTPLYTFTSVVDDIDHGITHIIRGEDHVTNTAVQIDLFAALTNALPKFAHLPLISGGEGEKLSKRVGSVSLRAMRKDGIEAAAITAYLARLGTSKDPAPLPLEELVKTFDMADFGRASPRFDPKQLLALNRKFLHHLDFAAVKDRLPEGATEEFWLAIRGNLDLLTEARQWWDIVAGEITTPDMPGEEAFCAAALDALPPEPWGPEAWKTWTKTVSEATGAKGRALFHPLRLALTSEDQGPEMAALLPLMGRARVAERLRRIVV
jgi:glutamyl-tRNA synthetase